MKYDIFISYSRKDIEFARKVCAVLDSYKQYYDFEYFFDQSEITSCDEYLKRISSAILESRVVLFLASKNSYDSEFCAKELLFADKEGRHIYQYLLDEAEMPSDIEMWLGTHQYRELKTTPMESVVYKVGDFYDDGTKKGVVFEVSEDGKHGKIVSLDETELKWCTYEQCCKGIQVGANSGRDGKTNTDIIMQRSDYAEYSAFRWCREQGEEWYLPSIDELRSIYWDKGLVNKTLTQYFYKEIRDSCYWSSTEKDDSFAWLVGMYGANTYDFDKDYLYYVRAVSAFVVLSKLNREDGGLGSVLSGLENTHIYKSLSRLVKDIMMTLELEPKSVDLKVYKVGDFYNDGTKRGVVFEVSEDGKHGKIVSLDEAELQWCTDEQWDKDILVGANSDRDGKTNTDVVMQRSDYAEYPAFKWCREQGEEWYLPSKEEVWALHREKDLVNKTLTKYSYKEIRDYSYWSSTERNEFCAWLVHMFGGDIGGNLKSYRVSYVRAVSAF